MSKNPRFWHHRSVRRISIHAFASVESARSLTHCSQSVTHFCNNRTSSLNITHPRPSANPFNERRLIISKPIDSLTERRRRHIDELINRIRESADKLAADGTSRGDLKLLSRAIAELRYAFKVFAPYRDIRKATVFGSARTQPSDPAYQQAVDLGRTMAALEWMVITGAGPGIMEAAHVGSGREHAMGLNIILPFEQDAHSVISGDPKLVNMKYFFTRKLMFVKECDAVVCIPGGFGTMDEALEVLTLLQTGKRDMIPVLLLNAPGDDYWDQLNEFIHKQLLERGMISEEDLALYRVTDSCAEAVEELTNFFRVYHSMRYVRDQLVFRVQAPLTEAHLEHINANFADILTAGKFELSTHLPAEKDEPALTNMPRLVFEFNRRNHGRLRQLIDYINSTAPQDELA